MLTNDHFKLAVEAGVLDAVQAENLKVFTPARRTQSYESTGADRAEEWLCFRNGFNDVFLTIGVVLIGLAMPYEPLMFFTSFVFWDSSEVLVRRTLAAGGCFVLALGIDWTTMRNRLVAALQRTPLGPYLTATEP